MISEGDSRVNAMLGEKGKGSGKSRNLISRRNGGQTRLSSTSRTAGKSTKS